MIPVEQTNYGKHKGNCLTACVASLLEVPISSIPEFCVDGEWFERLHKFCEENGFFLLYWRHTENMPMLALGAYIILLLQLEGEDDYHTVVGKTVLDYKTPITDAEVENCFALTELAGAKVGDIRWAWKTELVHDPNTRGYPTVVGPVGYIMIGKQ